jgi:aspartyl-tRNA(Asn)/glutamyl-tRNA(Gln) amidotransferase subunit C
MVAAPMAGIAPRDIEALAHLSRLELTPDEVRAYAGQLAAIVGYIEQLREVAVADVPEYLSPEVAGSALRPDSVGPMFTAEEAVSQAPERRGRMVVVPKFMED